MITKLNSYLLYPVILIYMSFLKGMKTDYKKFFIDKIKENKGVNTLHLRSKNWEFFNFVDYFFDKTSPFYNKVSISFDIDINTAPETKKYYRYNFYYALKFFYATSILSKRTSNDNLDIALKFEATKLSNTQLNNLIRYHLLAYGSRMIDSLYFDKELLKDQRSKKAYENMLSFLDGATIVNFSNSRHLYVLTIKKSGKTYDIVWSSDEDIELTDFGEVYDKYGNLMSQNIKVSNNPIYALHK